MNMKASPVERPQVPQGIDDQQKVPVKQPARLWEILFCRNNQNDNQQKKADEKALRIKIEVTP